MEQITSKIKTNSNRFPIVMLYWTQLYKCVGVWGGAGSLESSK